MENSEQERRIYLGKHGSNFRAIYELSSVEEFSK